MRWTFATWLALAAACRADAPVENRQPSEPKPASMATPEIRPVAPTDPHGSLETIEGQRVLRLWGTPREMGRAHGTLLRESILDVIDHYALDVITPAQLEAAGAVYTTTAEISIPIREEAEGIVEGMKAGGGAFVERLQRELEPVDLLVLGAMTDLVAIGCSSVSAWGVSTRASSSGDPMVVRNLDWSTQEALMRNQVVIVYLPGDAQRQPVVSVSFAGYLGCLSCLNEAGVTALFNMGYGDGAGTLADAARGFSPANLLLRDALERRETSSADALERRVEDATHIGSYIVHVVEPAGDSPARVLEVEADGMHVRAAGLAGADTVLAATNHLRGKDGPQACRRYATIARASRRRSHVWDAEGLWALATQVRLPEVVHTILIRPRTRDLRVWFRQPGERAHAPDTGVKYGWDALVRVPSTP